ncbi:MAG: nickel insertion protein, partial [bacterium]
MHLHLHSTSGISGDMLVGGFLGLGLPLDFLREQLEKLNLKGWEISQKSVEKLGVSAIQFQVSYEEQNHHRHLTDILEILSKSELSPKAKSIAEDLFQSLG